MSDNKTTHLDLPEFFQRWLSGDRDPTLKQAIDRDLEGFHVEVSESQGKALLQRALEEREVVYAQRLVMERLIGQPKVHFVGTQWSELKNRLTGGVLLQQVLEGIEDPPIQIREAAAGSPIRLATAGGRRVPSFVVMECFDENPLKAVQLATQAHVDRRGSIHLDIWCHIQRQETPIWYDGLAVVQHGKVLCEVFCYHEEPDGLIQIRGQAQMKEVRLDAPVELAHLDIAITLFPGLYDPHVPTRP